MWDGKTEDFWTKEHKNYSNSIWFYFVNECNFYLLSFKNIWNLSILPNLFPVSSKAKQRLYVARHGSELLSSSEWYPQLLSLILHNRKHNNIGLVYVFKLLNKVLSHTAPISIRFHYVAPEFWSVENTFKQLLYWTSRRSSIRGLKPCFHYSWNP
jgi:hypothetical protein